VEDIYKCINADFIAKNKAAKLVYFEPFIVFLKNANEVLEALKSYKLDDVKDDTSPIKINAKIEENDEMNLYFSKYLTSEKV
jgi:hypothetical protein